MEKAPDEIKKGLECHSLVAGGCAVCTYNDLGDGDCSGMLVRDALALIQQIEAANAELLTKVKQLEEKNEAYKQSASKCCYESRCNAQIKELEALCGRLYDEKEQLERERDAAVGDLKSLHACETCRHEILAGSPREYTCQIDDFNCDECSAKGCPCMFCRHGSNWEWRGVKEE